MSLKNDTGSVFPSGTGGFADDKVAPRVDEVDKSLSCRPFPEIVFDRTFMFGLSRNAAESGEMFPDGFGLQSPEGEILLLRCVGHR